MRALLVLFVCIVLYRAVAVSHYSAARIYFGLDTHSDGLILGSATAALLSAYPAALVQTEFPDSTLPDRDGYRRPPHRNDALDMARRHDGPVRFCGLCLGNHSPHTRLRDSRNQSIATCAEPSGRGCG
jgi:hypothetical protein